MRIKINRITIGAVITLTIALIIGAYYIYRINNKNAPLPLSSTTSLAPATPEEQKQAEDNKTRIIQEQSSGDPKIPPTTNNSSKSVVPTIVSVEVIAGNVEVSGYTPGVFEAYATCTTLFTKGTLRIQKDQAAVKNVSNMQCPTQKVPLSELSKGSWTITLLYSSSTAAGSSAPSMFEAP